MNNDKYFKAFKEAGRATEKLGKLLKKLKDESRILRILIWFDDLWFDIRRIIRKNIARRFK